MSTVLGHVRESRARPTAGEMTQVNVDLTSPQQCAGHAGFTPDDLQLPFVWPRLSRQAAEWERVSGLSEPQRMLVMADYGADPIWLRTADGRGTVSLQLERLPLSDGLIARLRAWAGAL